jgi:PIN domain nuclease of toxin-antitoxin system
MILLDTHVLVWVVDDDPRLGGQARAIIDRDGERRVSTMAAWELVMPAGKQRLRFTMALDAWFPRSMRDLEAHDVPVSREIACAAGTLPAGIHGDRCDRIIVATARHLGCPLVTADGKILAYAAAGHVAAIDARV